MKCRKCGAEIPDNSLFCSQCGNSLSNRGFKGNVKVEKEFSAPHTPAGKKNAGTAVRSKKKLDIQTFLLWMLAVFALIAVVVVLVVIENAEKKAESDAQAEAFIEKYSYSENLGKFGEAYHDLNTTDETIGGPAVINVTNILIENDLLKIRIGAPTHLQNLLADQYAYYIPLDRNGEEVDFSKYTLNEGNGEDFETEIVFYGIKNVSDVEYVEIGPYQNKGDKLIYKVSK